MRGSSSDDTLTLVPGHWKHWVLLYAMANMYLLCESCPYRCDVVMIGCLCCLVVCPTVFT